MERRTLTIRNRIQSFGYAVQGMITVYRTQPNLWLITAATVAVFVAGITLRVSRIEWCFLIMAIFLVWIAEIWNTAIEFLVDLVSPEIHPTAGKAKDAAAASVLVAAILAVIIGFFVLGPRLYTLVF